MTSLGTTTTNMSLPYVILTLSADALSRLLLVELGVEGGSLRADVEDADDGVSGIEAKVDVPVVGREDDIGEPGE